MHRNLLLGLIALTIPIQVSSQNGKPVENSTKITVSNGDSRPTWEDQLRVAFKNHSRPIAVELSASEKPLPLNLSPRMSDARRVTVLSWVLNRDVKSLSECAILLRPNSRATNYGSTTSAEFTELFLSLPADSLAELAKGASFWDLDPKLQVALGGLSNLNGGVMESILSGDPLEVQIELTPVVRIESSSGTYYVSPRTGAAPIDSPKIRSTTRSKEYNAPKLQRSATGISIEPGKVMPISELIGFYQKAFKETYRGDVKVLDEIIFVQGTFTKEEIEFVLERALTTETLSKAPWSRSNRWVPLKEKFAAQVAEFLRENPDDEIPYSEFAKAGSVDHDSLLGAFPMLKNDLIRGNYASGGRVPVSMGIAITLKGNGMAPSLYGTGTINGKNVPMMEPRQIRYILTP